MNRKTRQTRHAPPASAKGTRPFYAPIEDFAVSAASTLPFPLFSTWMRAYFQPEETIEKEKESATFGKIALCIAISGLIFAALSNLEILINIAFAPSAVPEEAYSQVFLLAMYIAYPITLLIYGFVGSAAIYTISKLLGGIGGYKEQTLGLAQIYAGRLLFTAPLVLLAQLPLVGIVFALLVLLPELFALYSFYRAIKHIHHLSSFRAALAVVAPFVALFLLVALITMVSG